MFKTIILIVLAGVVAVMGAAIIGLIARNLRQGEAFRQELAARLSRLRLQGALRIFGIDPARYLHTQAVADIEQHMQACAGCKETDRCDSTLYGGRPLEEFDFCPNYPALQGVKKMTGADQSPRTFDQRLKSFPSPG